MTKRMKRDPLDASNCFFINCTYIVVKQNITYANTDVCVLVNVSHTLNILMLLYIYIYIGKRALKR